MTLHERLTEAAALIKDTSNAMDIAQMEGAIDCIVYALASGRPLLVCGNGGSASDAMHITAELVGRFLLERRGHPVICLSANSAVLTAWSNDYSFESLFARQVEAYGQPGAVLLGISTSGTSANVVAAFETARRMEMKTVALTGEGGGKLARLSDFLLAVPSRHTPRIQEVHLCLYHYLCEEVEARMMLAQELLAPGKVQSSAQVITNTASAH